MRDRRHSVEIEKRTWMCDGHDVGLGPELNAICGNMSTFDSAI